jgi:hypothetical protein
MAVYVREDVQRHYGWLGHREGQVTEVLLLHKDYRPGREHADWNRQRKAYPLTRYVTNGSQLDKLVARYHGEYMIAVGINPRPKAFMNERGYPRSARESEIEFAQNIFMDFDFQKKPPSENQAREARRFMRDGFGSYWMDLGLKAPTLVYTGGGFHTCFAYPPVKVAEHPDWAARQKKLFEDTRQDLGQELDNLELRLDSTFELRRMQRLAGTSKPGTDRVSIWTGDGRVEDDALRNYLLSMILIRDEPAQPANESYTPAFGAPLVKVGSELPPLFLSLLNRDEKLKQFWSGNGKASGTDQSHTGFDYSIARRLLFLGYRNLDDIATVIAVRPDGAVKRSGKGEQYIRRTIANALMS